MRMEVVESDRFSDEGGMLPDSQENDENIPRLPIASSPALDRNGRFDSIATPPATHRTCHDLIDTENLGGSGSNPDLLVVSTPRASVFNAERSIQEIEDDDSSDEENEWTEFRYTVKNVSEKLRTKEKVVSDEFPTPNGWPWQLGIHFEGFNSAKPLFISCYVEMADVDTDGSLGKRIYDTSLPTGRSAQFKLDVLTVDGTLFSAWKSKRRDDAGETACGKLGDNHFHVHNSSDYGFERLILKRELMEYCVTSGDEVTFVAKVRARPEADIDSKHSTGMVGLLNQGATCYLNSLLQTLYHTRLLRKCVYELDTSSDKAEQGVALELQHLFADLQTKSIAVGTQNLTKAFGWTDNQVFTQHDVQELLRELLDKLEARMKSTPHENLIRNLFCGQYATYVKCLNVDCETSRTEDFFDLQLDVRGSESVMESFRKYVQEERLDGENQYDAEGFGKQDATKGVKFLHFPPVLHLHLKRFAYNFYEDRTYKIHDRFEFPEKLDLNEFVRHHPETTAENFTYRLHSVLVHSGNDQRGHYYAFVCLDGPEGPDGTRKAQWYKFNDEYVSKVKRKVAVDYTFGAGPVMKSLAEDGVTPMTWSDPKKLKFSSPPGYDAHSSAYMLVYVQEKKWNEIMCPVEPVPQTLLDRFQRDIETKIQERERAELTKNRALVQVATIDDVLAFHEVHSTKSKDNDDWVVWDTIPEFDYGDIRTATHNDLYRACERKFPKIAVQGRFRLWFTCSRVNNTLRMEELVPMTNQTIKQSEFNSKVFMEVFDLAEEMIPRRENELSLLFREFDPSLPGLVPGAGAFVANSGLMLHTSTTSDLWSVLANRVLNGNVSVREVQEQYDLFELVSLAFSERKNTRYIPYSNSMVIADDERKDAYNLEAAGDIIVYSRKPPSGCPSCSDYFKRKVHSFPIACRLLSRQDEIAVTIEVFADESVQNAVVLPLAEKHQVDPSRIRITFAETVANALRAQRTPVLETDYALSCMSLFTTYRKIQKKVAPVNACLFYEVLSMPRNEVDDWYLFSFVVHRPVEIAAPRKAPSTSIVRYDTPVVVNVNLPNSVVSNLEPLFEHTERQVYRTPSGGDSELVLCIIGGGRLEKVLNRSSLMDELILRSCPHGVPLLVSGGDHAYISDTSREPRLFGEIVMLPPPQIQRSLRVAVIHCTLKDEMSFPNELGVPSICYVWEGDSLGSFWKRLQARLAVPPEVTSSWRPLIGVNDSANSYLSPKLSFLDARDATVSSTNGESTNSSTIITESSSIPSGMSVSAPLVGRVKRPRVQQDEYDSLPLWSRHEIELALNRPSETNLPSIFIYIRHSLTVPGRTGTPVNSLTIRSS